MVEARREEQVEPFSVLISSRWSWLWLPVSVVTLYAISGTVTYDGSVLVNFGLYPFGDIVRSSGRLFWLATIVLISWSVYTLVRYWPLRAATIFLFAVVLLQIFDIRHGMLAQGVSLRNAPEIKLDRQKWSVMLENATLMNLVPANNPHLEKFYPLILYAIDHGVRVNTMYMARFDPNKMLQKTRLQFEILRVGQLSADELIIFTSDTAAMVPAIQSLLHILDGWFVIPPKLISLSGSVKPDFVFRIAEPSGPLSFADLIARCQKDCTVLFAATYDSSSTLSQAFVDSMVGRGGSKNRLESPDSWTAVMHEGRIVAEGMGQEGLVQVVANVQNVPLRVFGSGARHGNQADFHVGQYIHFALRGRSLNALVLNWQDMSATLYRYDVAQNNKF